MVTSRCSLFAILGMLSEIRTRWLVARPPLRSLNFLKSYFGRGCYLIYIGGSPKPNDALSPGLRN